MALTSAQKLIIAIALLVILAGVFVMSLKGPRVSGESVEMLIQQQPAPEIVVHIVGEVKQPGLYHLSAGDRVADAIKIAGGFAEDADLATVNLAAVLDDGQQITVGKIVGEGSAPAHEQPVESPEQAGQKTEPPTSAPAPETPLQPHAQGRQASQPPGLYPGRQISINRAQPQELELLPGIGPELAKRICYYRYEHGGFSSVDELLKVRGIGQDTLEQIKPYITL